MARNSIRAQQGRAIARQRQADLAKSRVARDQRILDLTTRVLVAIGSVQDAKQAVTDGEVALGHATRDLLAEHVPVGDASTLTGLPPGELARLRRLSKTNTGQDAATALTIGADSLGSGVHKAPAGSLTPS